MTRLFKAPNIPFVEYPVKSVFLGGSIEMGLADNWQTRVWKGISDLDLDVYDPRRENWDSTWEQSIENEQFREQVEWELDHINSCDLVVFYFDPNTKSPVTMMEFGLMAWSDPSAVVVCCPDGFWRKGNIDIVCAGSNITQVNDIDELIQYIREFAG